MTPAPCLERGKGSVLVPIIQFLQGRGNTEGCPIGHRVIQFLEKYRKTRIDERLEVMQLVVTYHLVAKCSADFQW
jgi:tRNA(Arg) A34 adenosine deaminase TadA